MGRRSRAPIDRTLGIETSRKVRVRPMPGDGALVRNARDYEPTDPELFEQMMSEVRLSPEQLSFIDLGAGKGRVLCLAAQFQFKQVIGVELFSPLVEQAQKNLRALPSSWVRASHLSCVKADAGKFRFPVGPKVVYMFNPFRTQVLQQVLNNLRVRYEDEVKQKIVPIYILYLEPVFEELLDTQPWLERRARSRSWSVWATPDTP